MRTKDQIEAAMDQAYAKWIQDNPNGDIPKVTVMISKDEYDLLQQWCRDNSYASEHARLVGWCTENAPWGFRLSHTDKLKSPEVLVVSL